MASTKAASPFAAALSTVPSALGADHDVPGPGEREARRSRGRGGPACGRETGHSAPIADAEDVPPPSLGRWQGDRGKGHVRAEAPEHGVDLAQVDPHDVVGEQYGDGLGVVGADEIASAGECVPEPGEAPGARAPPGGQRDDHGPTQVAPRTSGAREVARGARSRRPRRHADGPDPGVGERREREVDEMVLAGEGRQRGVVRGAQALGAGSPRRRRRCRAPHPISTAIRDLLHPVTRRPSVVARSRRRSPRDVRSVPRRLVIVRHACRTVVWSRAKAARELARTVARAAGARGTSRPGEAPRSACVVGCVRGARADAAPKAAAVSSTIRSTRERRREDAGAARGAPRGRAPRRAARPRKRAWATSLVSAPSSRRTLPPSSAAMRPLGGVSSDEPG